MIAMRENQQKKTWSIPLSYMQIFLRHKVAFMTKRFSTIREAVKLVSLKFTSFHTNFSNFFTFFLLLHKWVHVKIVKLSRAFLFTVLSFYSSPMCSGTHNSFLVLKFDGKKLQSLGHRC